MRFPFERYYEAERCVVVRVRQGYRFATAKTRIVQMGARNALGLACAPSCTGEVGHQGLNEDRHFAHQHANAAPCGLG